MFLVFLTLFSLSRVSVELNINDLSSKHIFSYSYSNINDNDKSEYESLNKLKDYKYMLKDISIYSLHGNKVFSLPINKTVSRVNLTEYFIVNNQLLHTNVNNHHDHIDYKDGVPIPWYNILGVSLILVLFIFIAIRLLRYLYCKISQYLVGHKLCFNNDFNPLYGVFYLIISIFALYLSYVTHFMDLNRFFNTDMLFMNDLFNGLIIRGDSFKDWNLTTVPFYFPDYIIFAISYLISNVAYYNFLIYAILQILITNILLYLILQNFMYKKNSFVMSTLVVLIWTLCAIFSEYFAPFISSIFHFGTVINIFIFFIVIFKFTSCEKNTIRFFYAFLVLLLAFVAVISDPWFMFWCIVPFFLAILLSYSRNNQSKNNNNLLYLVFIALIFGFLAILLAKYFVVRAATPPISINIFNLGSLARKAFYFKIFMHGNYLYFTTMAVFMLFLRDYYRQNYYECQKVTTRLLVNYMLLLLPVVFIVIVCVSTVDFILRYFTHIMMFYICITVLYFVSRYGYKLLNFILVSAIFFVVFLFTKTQYSYYYPNDVALIDKHLQNSKVINQRGMAPYWIARKFNFLTKTDNYLMTIIESNGKLNTWQNHIYTESGNYNFIIFNDYERDDNAKIEQSTVIQFNGTPSAVYNCNDMTLMIYPLSTNLRLE